MQDSNSEKTSKLKRQDSSDDYHDTKSQHSPANSTAQGEPAETDIPQENQKFISHPLEIETPGNAMTNGKANEFINEWFAAKSDAVPPNQHTDETMQESKSFFLEKSQVSIKNDARKLGKKDNTAVICCGTFGKYCAIKMLNKNLAHEPKNELDIAMKLWKGGGHNCIVTFYGVWENQAAPQGYLPSCLVMELCLENTLNDHLEARRKKLLSRKVPSFPFKEKVDLLLDVAKGMNFIHSHNIVHGNLHAGKILLTEKEGVFRAKVAGFGLSTDTRDGNQSIASSRLNKDIMPPEILANIKSADRCQLTQAVDVFSFGCLMIHVGSCKFPIPKQGKSALASRKHLFADIRVDNKERFLQTIEKLLSQNPEDRGTFPSLLTQHLNKLIPPSEFNEVSIYVVIMQVIRMPVESMS